MITIWVFWRRAHRPHRHTPRRRSRLRRPHHQTRPPRRHRNRHRHPHRRRQLARIPGP